MAIEKLSYECSDCNTPFSKDPLMSTEAMLLKKKEKYINKHFQFVFVQYKEWESPNLWYLL